MKKKRVAIIPAEFRQEAEERLRDAERKDDMVEAAKAKATSASDGGGGYCGDPFDQPTPAEACCAPSPVVPSVQSACGRSWLHYRSGTPPQLGYVRSKRFAAVFEDGKCTNMFVSAAPGDPAGDDDPSASLVENVLKSL